MVDKLVDGREAFKVPYETFLRGQWTKIASRSFIDTPNIKDISDEHAVKIFVSHGHLLAPCPCGGAEYVWREGPHIVACASCGNADIGGKMRRVIIPDNLVDVERELVKRPMMANRNWFADEPIENIIEENERHGL